MQRLWRATLFNKGQLTPGHPPPDLYVRACVIELWRNLSLCAERRQDFITIGANVRKAIIAWPWCAVLTQRWPFHLWLLILEKKNKKAIHK